METDILPTIEIKLGCTAKYQLKGGDPDWCERGLCISHKIATLLISYIML